MRGTGPLGSQKPTDPPRLLRNAPAAIPQYPQGTGSGPVCPAPPAPRTPPSEDAQAPRVTCRGQCTGAASGIRGFPAAGQKCCFQPTVGRTLRSETQGCAGPTIRLCVSGPVQFRPALFRGRLQFDLLPPALVALGVGGINLWASPVSMQPGRRPAGWHRCTGEAPGPTGSC